MRDFEKKSPREYCCGTIFQPREKRKITATLILEDHNTLKINGKYGLFVGISIDSALTNRPNLNFHSDLHYNIYASVINSKIQYRLNGEFKSLNDSSFVAEDYSVEQWQIEGMKIEYLIWKK